MLNVNDVIWQWHLYILNWQLWRKICVLTCVHAYNFMNLIKLLLCPAFGMHDTWYNFCLWQTNHVMKALFLNHLKHTIQRSCASILYSVAPCLHFYIDVTVRWGNYNATMANKSSCTCKDHACHDSPEFHWYNLEYFMIESLKPVYLCHKKQSCILFL